MNVVHVPVRDGEQYRHRPVPCFASPVAGLVITPDLGRDGESVDARIENPTGWVITHESSGACVGVIFPAVEAAGGGALALADVTDWTADFVDLAAGDVFRRAGARMREFLADAPEAVLDPGEAYHPDKLAPPADESSEMTP